MANRKRVFTVSTRSRLTLKTCIFKFRNRIAEETPYWKISTQFWAERQDVKADTGYCSRD